MKETLKSMAVILVIALVAKMLFTSYQDYKQGDTSTFWHLILD
jgi:hypothetical protein